MVNQIQRLQRVISGHDPFAVLPRERHYCTTEGDCAFPFSFHHVIDQPDRIENISRAQRRNAYADVPLRTADSCH